MHILMLFFLHRVAFQNLFSEMRHFMRRHDLTVFLQNRVMNYMDLLWAKYQYDLTYFAFFLCNICKSLQHWL